MTAALVAQRQAAPASEEDRFTALQQSVAFDRDPGVSSMRNHLIDLYERIASLPPEAYVASIYADVLPRSEAAVFPESGTEANYTAAATFTARDPINNRTRWALQAALVHYAIVHGYDEMTRRAQDSTEFSYQIHISAFGFANDASTIGRLPWALLTHINVPVLGEQVGGAIYLPEAYLVGTVAGLEQLARDPLNTAAANAAFDAAYLRTMEQKYTLGGRIINTTIENLNSPHGYSGMPWWGVGLRVVIDGLSFLTQPLYD